MTTPMAHAFADGDTTAEMIVAACSSVEGRVSCALCRAALKERVRVAVMQWSVVKVRFLCVICEKDVSIVAH